jgi:hypothetical protein
MQPDQHTLRSRVYSPDIRYGDATLGPTRHPTNALAMRAVRPKKKLPAISTAQAMLRTRPAIAPVTIGGKQPPRGK